MKNKNKLAQLLLVVIAVVSVALLLLRNTGNDTDPAIAKASTEFKSNPGSRQKVANKLLPHIQGGTSIAQVRSLLGEPDKAVQSPDGMQWHYGLFYSMFIDIVFDEQNKVKTLQACADSDTDTRHDGTGVYSIGLDPE